MKKISLIISVLLFTFFSCTKDNGTATLITYRLEGLTDLTLDFHKPETFILNFNQKGTISEKISLYFSDLPVGVSIDSNYVKSGTPDFSSFISFITDSTLTTAGIYTISLHCIGSVSGEKKFPFNVTIPGKTRTIFTNFLGVYSNCHATSYNFNSKLSYQDSIIVDTTAPATRVIFENFLNVSNVFANIYNNDSLDIPLQLYNGNNYSGTGHFTNYTITIHYHSNTGLIDTGVIVMQR